MAAEGQAHRVKETERLAREAATAFKCESPLER